MEKSTNALKRLDYMDIAKGIGIIIVVWAHSNGPLSKCFDQFSMALFFSISGYLFNSKNTVREFVIKKIKTLYIPFLGWNLIFLPIYWLTYYNGTFDWTYFLKNIFLIVTTIQRVPYYLGATWFLPALFWVSIGYKILDTYIADIKYKRLFITLIFILGAIIGFQAPLPFSFSRVLVLGMVYAFGYAVRVYKEYLYKFDKSYIAIVCIVIYGIIGYFNEVDMGRNVYKYKSLFIIGAICVIYFIIYVSKMISRLNDNIVHRLLVFLGKNSMDILIWQFVSFKIVIAVQLLLEYGSVSRILEFYPTYISSNGWWIIYTIVGLFVSILWIRLLKSLFIGKLLKKIYLIN